MKNLEFSFLLNFHCSESTKVGYRDVSAVTYAVNEKVNNHLDRERERGSLFFFLFLV